MKTVDILVYNNFPLQTELFVETFTKVNKCDEYNFVFEIVGTPDIESKIEYENLIQVDDSYRFSFLSKIDEIISRKHDFLIIADGRCMSLRPIKMVLDALSTIPVDSWHMCGDYVSPTFPLIFTSEYNPVDYFVFINFGFAILNPKNMNSNNTEKAKEFIPDSMNLYIDRYALNMIYDKKIIECGLCIDRNAHCKTLSTDNADIFNVVMDIYKTDTASEYNSIDFAEYFLGMYLDEASGELRNEILRRRKEVLSPKSLAAMHSDYILNKAVMLRQNNEFEVIVEPMLSSTNMEEQNDSNSI